MFVTDQILTTKTINNFVCTLHLSHKKCYIKTYDILCVLLHAKCVIYEE